MHWHGPTSFYAVREAREMVWWEKAWAHGREMPWKYFCSEFILGGFYIQLFPLGKAHNAHFSTSIWCNESWEASMPSMCLNHIIAMGHTISSISIPLKLAPTCLIKQCGTSRTHKFELLLLLLLFYFLVGVPCEMFGIWGLWKYLSNSILHAPNL